MSEFYLGYIIGQLLFFIPIAGVITFIWCKVRKKAFSQKMFWILCLVLFIVSILGQLGQIANSY